MAELVVAGAALMGGAVAYSMLKKSDIDKIVKEVGLNSYLECRRQFFLNGKNPEYLDSYWSRHQQVLKQLYLILKKEEPLWPGANRHDLFRVAETLNNVARSNRRPIEIIPTEKDNEGKMFLGPANFAYYFDGTTMPENGDLIKLIATDPEISMYTNYPERSHSSRVTRIPGCNTVRIYMTTSYNFPAIPMRSNPSVKAKLDEQTAQKIFGSVSREKIPVKVGNTVHFGYDIVRLGPSAKPRLPETIVSESPRLGYANHVGETAKKSGGKKSSVAAQPTTFHTPVVKSIEPNLLKSRPTRIDKARRELDGAKHYLGNKAKAPFKKLKIILTTERKIETVEEKTTAEIDASSKE